MSRRTKIVCTLGPRTCTFETIRSLVDAGMDVARLNFSHGTHAEHAALCAHVRRAARESGRAVGVLADLQGPKLRLGRFAEGGATLEAGAEFVITTEPVLGDAHRVATGYADLPRDVHAADTLLIDDGAVRLEVIAVEGEAVRTRVVEGGRVTDHKGLNLPGVRVSAPTLTPKDREDLAFAVGASVDWIALSFVRSPDDAATVRRLAPAGPPVIAKIERPEAVERLDAIVEAFDGVMVARGDLGVELPLVEVPGVQRRAIEVARTRGRPVIVATQMLESMVTHLRPTRAEVSDVANAVLDGADAVMLSAETSVGAHPLAAVTTMSDILSTTEADALHRIAPLPRPAASGRDDAIAAAATALARDLGARATVAFTRTGSSALRLARHRAAMPLVALTPHPPVRERLALVWGVETIVVPPVDDPDGMIRQVERALIEGGRATPGDLVVIVAGSPDVAGATHTIRVHRLASVPSPK